MAHDCCQRCGRDRLDDLRRRLQERVDRPGAAGMRWYPLLRRAGIRVAMYTRRVAMWESPPMHVYQLYEDHHVVPRCKGGAFGSENVIRLCVCCHKRETVALLQGNQNARGKGV